MHRNRLLSLLFVLSVVLLAAVAGWIAGSNIASPAEAAARIAPPNPSPILVPVEERLLASSIVTRGTARFGSQRDISIVPSEFGTTTEIITWLPARSSQLLDGDVLLVVSGRPVFVIQGELSVYRDLVPGLVGEDVQQLETALQRFGFDPGPVDGVYDVQTGLAVGDWYLANDWEPLGPMDDQIMRIHELEQDLTEANLRLALAEETLTIASTAVEIARISADTARLSAAADVLQRTSSRDAVARDENAIDNEVAMANILLDIALTAEQGAILGGEQAVQQALSRVESAKREIAAATQEVNQITDSLEQAHSESGIIVPASEVVFVPSLPLRVGELYGSTGDRVDGPVMALTDNHLVIDSSLPLDEASLVQAGMAVTIDESDLGITATGTVVEVAESPGTSGVDGFHIYLQVSVDATSVSLDGFSLRLMIPVQTTGEAALVVPVSAIFLTADGVSSVQIEDSGQLEFVVVEPGLAADGFVEVKSPDDALQPGQMVVIGFEETP